MLAHTSNVDVHTLADVERVQFDVRRIGQPQPEQRVQHGEGLSRLRRIEVYPCLLVDEVQAWPNDGNPANAARLHQVLCHQFAKRHVELIVGPKVTVERDAAALEKLKPALIFLLRPVLEEFVAHATKIAEQIFLYLGSVLRSLEREALLHQEVAHVSNAG